MTPERLLSLYYHVADAPEAIPRLRCLILDLAVRGKLVEQDPTDEPAYELLKRIAAEKTRLVKEDKIKGRRYPPHRGATNQRFVIPSTWCWCRLDEVGKITGGGTPSAADPTNFAEPGKGMPWLTPADLGSCKDLHIKRGARDLTDKGLQSSSTTMMPAGTVLFTSRAPIGYVAIAANPISTNQGFKSIVPYMTDFSCFIALVMRAFAPEIDANAPGTTFKEISGKIVSSINFPLPPLAEQHRIVAKVDELMTLCDQLEATKDIRETTRVRLTEATLGRLSNPDGQDGSFRSDARFTLKAFTALTHHADQIKQLRQSILNLAVRGKLVEQDPADEPASELLKRIAAERSRLVKAGKIKKKPTKKNQSVRINGIENQTNAALSSTDVSMFSLPKIWAWTQIAEIGVLSPRNNVPDNCLVSFVSMSMIPIAWGTQNAHKDRYWKEIKKGYTHFADGDVGLAKITPCFENGKSVVFRGLTGGIGSGTTELHIVRPIIVNPDYILLFLKSSLFIDAGIQKMTGTAGQKRVPKDYFATSPFPLPPLAEQHRIVAKVDELMKLCDQLEVNLTLANTGRQQLLESLIRNMLENADTKAA